MSRAVAPPGRGMLWSVVVAVLAATVAVGLRPVVATSSAALVDRADATTVWQAADSFSSAWMQVSAGEDHTCAIDPGGAAWCWGSGESGRLGRGSTTDSLVPVRVTTSQMQEPLVAISAGAAHTCAVDVNGKPWCWGAGGAGRLGRGSTTGSTTPVEVTTTAMSAPVTQVSAGEQHTCAIAAGSAWCWGLNTWGQVGDLSSVNRTTPTLVLALSMGQVTDISAGGRTTCAVSQERRAWCWGAGDWGRLGNDDQFGQTQFSPVPVARLTGGMLADIATITVGTAHACAVDVNGKPWCWGLGDNGRLGRGSTAIALAPAAVTVGGTGMPSSVTAITAGGAHTCAVVATGAAWCWGAGASGRIGDGAQTNRTTPVRVGTTQMTSPVEHLTAGGAHTCAIADGEVWCWGSNANGRLGTNDTTNRLTPTRIVDG